MAEVAAAYERDRPIIPRSLEAAELRGSSRSRPDEPQQVAGPAVRRSRILQGRASAGDKGGCENTSEAAEVGIAVAKATLDVAVRPSGDERHLANDPAGIAAAVAW
jgi:hypothetical protein